MGKPMIKVQRLCFLGSLVGIYLFSWIIQSHHLIGWDISWGLHETKRLLAGGQYASDFFEPSPPMFLYLYAPTFLIAKTLSISLFSAFRLTIFILTSLSLLLCYPLLRSIAPLFTLILAITLLVLPGTLDFGQREHLLVILSMPYFLLVAARLENRHVNVYMAAIIGFLAGLGFAIKPFFLITFGLIELYYLFYNKSLLAWMRVETLVILGVFIFYIAIICIFHRNYITIMLPVFMDLYYQGCGEKWSALIFEPAIIYCFIVMCCCAMLKSDTYKALNALFIIALIGFLISYFVQRTTWNYHLLPAYSMAFLLLSLFFFTFLLPVINKRSDIIFFAMFSFLIFSFPVCYSFVLYSSCFSYEKKITGLIEFMKIHAENKPVYFFSTALLYEFPAVDYANAIPASKYAAFTELYCILKKIHRAHDNKDIFYLMRKKTIFEEKIADEIITKKPILILVDMQKNKSHLEGIPFDFLPDFLQSKKFQAAWKDYRYLSMLENKVFYKIAVYERIKR